MFRLHTKPFGPAQSRLCCTALQRSLKCNIVPIPKSLKTRARTRNWSDRVLECLRILRVEPRLPDGVFVMLSRLIFKCNVDGGISSFAPAPLSPATLPLLSARAASMSPF
jgi:hypothetical protein